MAAQKETQPDKLEKIKRFEKERKAMQKKEEGIEHFSNIKPAKTKPKKRGGTNWTRIYENGLFDEDEFEY